MIVAVDLDEVLGDFTNSYLAFYNERQGTSWRRTQLVSYNFWETLGGTKEEQLALFEEFVHTVHFETIPPFEHAIRALGKLRERHTLILVTARPATIERETRAWLDAHYPGFFSRVHLTNQFAQEGFWRSKAQICEEEGADVIIEDSLEYAQECAARGTRVLLMDAPWNQHESLPEGIVRVHSWDEIERELSRTGP